jgi:hypothetical protein
MSRFMKTRQVSSLMLGHRNTDGQTWTLHKVDDGEYALDVDYALVVILSLYSCGFVRYSHPAVTIILRLSDVLSGRNMV